MAEKNKRLSAEMEIAALRRHFTLLHSKTHLDIHVADHCNFGCRGCLHYAPVAQPHLLDLEKYEHDLALLSSVQGADGYFLNICLMGGEPLLHPQAGEVARLTRKYFPKTEIVLVTNGLLLKSMDEGFWRALRESNISLYLSGYPIPVDYQSLISLARQEGVKSDLCKNVTQSPSDKKINEDKGHFWKLPLDETGSQNPVRAWNLCPVSDFMQLRDGRLFPCNHGTYTEQLNRAFGTAFSHEEGDWLALSDIKSVAQIDEFRARPHPMCRFCNMDAMEVVPWARTEREKREWVSE